MIVVYIGSYIGSIDEAKQFAYQTVDATLVLRNWYIARIVNEARSQLGVLSWTHYRILTQVEDTAARKWYEKEAYEQVWSTTTLQRNKKSCYCRIPRNSAIFGSVSGMILGTSAGGKFVESFSTLEVTVSESEIAELVIFIQNYIIIVLIRLNVFDKRRIF